MLSSKIYKSRKIKTIYILEWRARNYSFVIQALTTNHRMETHLCTSHSVGMELRVYIHRGQFVSSAFFHVPLTHSTTPLFVVVTRPSKRQSVHRKDRPKTKRKRRTENKKKGPKLSDLQPSKSQIQIRRRPPCIPVEPQQRSDAAPHHAPTVPFASAAVAVVLRLRRRRPRRLRVRGGAAAAGASGRRLGPPPRGASSRPRLPPPLLRRRGVPLAALRVRLRRPPVAPRPLARALAPLRLAAPRSLPPRATRPLRLAAGFSSSVLLLSSTPGLRGLRLVSSGRPRRSLEFVHLQHANRSS
jgi:hypothetical protein